MARNGIALDAPNFEVECSGNGGVGTPSVALANRVMELHDMVQDSMTNLGSADNSELPGPLVPKECDLRKYNLPMPVDAHDVVWGEWVTLTDRQRVCRTTLMAYAWINSPTGSIIGQTENMWRVARSTRRMWKMDGPSALRAFILCSDGRMYHPYLAKHAVAIWKTKSVTPRLSITDNEWRDIRKAVFARDKFTCVYCGHKGGRLECDHVLPVSRGGSNELTNLVTACPPCNRDKGTRLVNEWMQ